ncbi:tRNA (adenosine(37)-N6)-dimethylallyltransferase MiaA [Teredinibacter sp. KSP-S5-2]|uniref:tRNA (adenosine(37)-N6)-dimethylallyltransferase MiaA n=1 Tax=Teredinibacter sp. KSP-S5-2 TaxID=3034506 RepID=UPI002934C87C|nr:tRNA (adenosine(37)-N6)-dimethylallyltransferase MiaA [Teredinibacter sp. KSP-S5-2]WNO08174.1 tRNA (adenosine(37)-N6)-dimethylallyltransferase MiaA [Teredinibacter sp. KSP-S5-2]
MSGQPRIIAIMGPTAAGKTDLAIALRNKLNAELISVDSALVYTGMDIGSAKPSKDELAAAPHRLIDIRDPGEPYSAADFCLDAKREIEDIIQQGKTPILVGGTMMYFKALREGLSDLPAADEQVRAAIEADAAQYGWPHIHAQLTQVDPDAAARIHPNHSQRLSRALEVYRVTGRPMSELQRMSVGGLMYDYQWVQMAVAPRDRGVLHERIARRFDLMLENGLLEEVRHLRERGDLHKDLPAIRAVGYRQVWEYLDGLVSYEEMREKGKAATRQLAKRQLTWLRGWDDLNWVYTQNENGQLLSDQEIVTVALNFVPTTTI